MTNNNGPRLTTRSIRTAEHIADAKPFTTSGNMRGEANTGTYVYTGHLNQVECEILRDDLMGVGVDYVVWSFSTPIAWRRTDGRWRIVAQSFSVTTSKHQSNLYKIERERHETVLVKTGTPGMRHRVRCNTCGTDLREFALIGPARDFAHGHAYNSDHPIYSADPALV